ncbi:MAG: hypothetical protein M0002_04745 [Rhodospirillales bacterium]|nr:hypothetical protein [Rhodospirillales bacterium]
MSKNPAATRRAFARGLAAMERQAGQSKAYVIELYGGGAALELLAAAVAGDGEAAERLRAVSPLISGALRSCSACGGPLDFPAVIGLLRPARETPGELHALGLACCMRCAAEGETALRAKLLAFFGGRSLEPTHAAPGATQ